MITYNKLSNLFPNDTVGYYQIGKLFFRRGDYDIAHDNFLKIITIDPLQYKSHVYLAIIYRVEAGSQKNLDDILGHLHQAKDEAANNRKFKILIYKNFAEIFEEQNNVELAIKYYTIVNGLQPENTDYLLHLADLHLKKKKYVTALNLYLTAHGQRPNNTFILNQIANLYAYMSKYESAVQFFRLLIAEEPDNLTVIITLGQVLRDKMGRYEEAIEVFRKGIECEGSHLALYEVS